MIIINKNYYIIIIIIIKVSLEKQRVDRIYETFSFLR